MPDFIQYFLENNAGTWAIFMSVFLILMFGSGLWNNRRRRDIFAAVGRLPGTAISILMPQGMRERSLARMEEQLNYLGDPYRAHPERMRWIQGAGVVLAVLLAFSAATWLSEGRERVAASLPGMTSGTDSEARAPKDFAVTVGIVLSFMLGTLGWNYPRMSLGKRVERRKQRLLLQLADLLELMEITMRAGAEFDQALETAAGTIYERYIVKPEQYPLGIELAQALFERNMGVSRADFMESLGLRATMRVERNENEFGDAAVALWDELTQAVTLSQETGSNLRETLPDIVERVRSGRLKSAEQRAATARVTITYPQTLLVLALMLTLLAAVGLFVSNLSLTP
jgi:hypothetical protein